METQALVRRIQTELYRPFPAGLCDMDDYGDLEGWYNHWGGISSSSLASKMYEIGSPFFPQVTAKLPREGSGTFTIRAHHVSVMSEYIQSAKLNGKPLTAPHFAQTDMVSGGSLVFEMGPKPNYSWGTNGR